MKIRILHQGLIVGGKVRCEGEELETQDPHAMSFALGESLLSKDRQTNSGQRIAGDRRAALNLTEPTPEEIEIMRAAEEADREPPRSFWQRRKEPTPVELTDESAAKVAHAMNLIQQKAAVAKAK